MMCAIRRVSQCLTRLQDKTMDYDNSGAMIRVKLYSTSEMLTLSSASLGTFILSKSTCNKESIHYQLYNF